MRALTSLTLAALLVGCATGQMVGEVDTPAGHRVDMVGIPVLGAAYSSGTQVTPECIVTVRHTGWPRTTETSRRYDARVACYEQEGVHSTPGPRVVEGQRVRLYGASPLGGSLMKEATVLQAHGWACHPYYDPVVHDIRGACTEKGKGYAYGFWMDTWVSHGYSGGGVYDEQGRWVGMIQSLGWDEERGRWVAFAYHAEDLMEEFGL